MFSACVILCSRVDLFALLLIVVLRYVSDSRITASGAPPVKIMFFGIEAYRKHSIS
jgi:hypothetical protein